jgi:hypothetical protein
MLFLGTFHNETNSHQNMNWTLGSAIDKVTVIFWRNSGKFIEGKKRWNAGEWVGQVNAKKTITFFSKIRNKETRWLL